MQVMARPLILNMIEPNRGQVFPGSLGPHKFPCEIVDFWQTMPKKQAFTKVHPFKIWPGDKFFF